MAEHPTSSTPTQTLHATTQPPHQILDRLALSDPRPLAQTPRANLWRVRMQDGRDAVLKCLTTEGAESDEARAGDILAQWDGQNAARVFASHTEDPQQIAFLIEYLDGPSLGDLARSGEDIAATVHLAQIATALSRPAVPGFPSLETNGLDLMATSPSALPASHRELFARAQTLWPQLIASTTQQRLLHGDLHHDNILKGSRQQDADKWCAIDPRGLNGDPAYEFANAFRNPTGMKGAVADTSRMTAMADVFAAHSGLDRARLIDFAFAHCAMSLSWTLKSTPPSTPLPKGDLRILELLATLRS